MHSSAAARRRRLTPVCPHCDSSDNVAEILYGLIPFKPYRRDDEPPIELGGCVIDDDSPRWICRACNLKFGRIEED